MDVFNVGPDDIILVYQRDLLFRFQVAGAEPGKASVDMYLPLYGNDGRPSCLENLQSDTVEIGEPCVFEQEESELLGIEAGTVEITIASVDGENATVYVNAPDGWGVVKNDDSIQGED